MRIEISSYPYGYITGEVVKKATQISIINANNVFDAECYMNINFHAIPVNVQKKSGGLHERAINVSGANRSICSTLMDDRRRCIKSRPFSLNSKLQLGHFIAVRNL